VRFGRNLAAGIAYTLITAAVSLAVVPLYLRYLGIEAYGLIGFNMTLQGVLQLLDLGLTPAVSREVARAREIRDAGGARTLLRTLEVVFWAVAALIGIGIALSAPLIADRWLDAGTLGQGSVAAAVALMGITIAARWPAGLYAGALVGAHRMTVVSALGVGYILIANLGVVLVLAFWSATIEAFFIWQAGCALAYSLSARIAAWRVLEGRGGARFDLAKLRSIARFAIGLSGVALTGIVVTQLDKVMLSRLLPLSAFGQYMLATAVVTALYGFINAVFRVVFPRFTAVVTRGSEDELIGDYRLLTAGLGSTWLPMMTVVAICAHPLLLLWTGSPAVADATAPILSILAIGTALHGMMYLPFSVQLAMGATRLPLTINLVLVAIQVPLIVLLTLRLGALGGAFAWLVLHLVYLHLGTFLMHRRIMRGWGLTWLWRDVYPRLGWCLVFGAAGAALIARTDPPWLQLLVGAGAGLGAMGAALLSSGYRLAAFKRLLTT
jgi:O-antigen/teichoic acid export membrane protein